MRLRLLKTRSNTPEASQEQIRKAQFLANLNDITLSPKSQLANQISANSEEVYKSLVNHVGIGVFRTTPGITGRFLEVNPAMEEITGYSREELLEMNVADLFVHPEERGEIVRKVLSGELTTQEVLFKKKDGTVILVRDNKIAVTGDDGHSIYFEGFIEDITEYKKTEDELRKSEARYRNVVQLANDGICIIQNMMVKYCNPKLAEMGGRAVEEIINTNFSEYIHPDALSMVVERYKRRMAGEQIPSRYETVLRHKDGRKIEVELSVGTLDYLGQEAEIAIVHDISERKQTQALLADSEEKFRTLAEQSPNMIFINKNGRVIYANNKCTEIMGYGLDEFYSPNFDFLTLIKVEFRAAVMANIETHMSGHEIGPCEYSLITKDGRIIDCILASKLINFDGGLAILGTITDITERKRMETGIRELNDTLKLIRNINQLIVRSDSESELLQKGCDELARNERYPLAWVGFIQDGSFDVLPVAKAGNKVDHLSSLKVTWDDSLSGQGPTGMTVKTGKPHIVSDLVAESRFDPSRNKTLLLMGFRSSITLPLIIHNQVIGVLNIYSVTVDAFHEQEIDLFIELAQDLSLGIEKIRTREERIKAEKRLADEVVRRRILVEQSSDGIVVLDQEGKVFEANRRFAEMLGYSSDGVLQLHVWDWDNRTPREQFAPIPAKITGPRFETKHHRKDGTIFDVEISSNEVIIAGQKLVFCVCRDITERKKVEEELLRRAMLLDAANDAILLYDLEGNILYANEAMCRSYGMKREQLPNWNTLDKSLIEPGRFRTRIEEIKKNGTLTFEVGRQNPDGSICYIEVRAQIVQIRGKELILSASRDITERKRAEEELSRRAVLLDAATDGILLHDLEGNILYANEALCRINGMKREQLLHLDNLNKSVTVLEPLEIRVQKMHRNGLLTSEMELRDIDGNVKYFDVQAQIVRIADKDLVLVVSRDISERKQAEALYRTLAEDSPVGIYFLQNGASIFSNNAFRQATGFQREEILGKNSLDLVHPDDRDQVRNNAIAMLKGNNLKPYEFRYLTKTGETRWALERVSSIIYRGQRAVLGNFIDITEIKRTQEALREAKDKYENLVNNVGVGVFVSTAGTPGKFVQVNKVMEQITGYSREELLKIDIDDTYSDPTDRQLKLEGFMTNGPTVPIERMLKRKDGSLAVTRSWMTATKSFSGDILFYEGIMEDITERRKMEESLHFSNAAFRSIHDGIFATDNNFVVNNWNRTSEKIFGIKASDAMGKRINDVIELVEEFPGHNQKRVDALLSKGYDQEKQLYRTPLGDRWLDVHTQVIEFGGERVGWVTLVADITERKQAEDSLKKSEEKLRLMFGSVTDGIVVIDLQGIITDVNQAILNMLGLGIREEAIGRSVLDFISPEYRESIQADLKKDPQEALLYKRELLVLRSDGQMISVEVSAGLLRDVSDHPIGSVVTVRDVSEARKMQQQLLAQDRLASIGQLVSGVAHEINNPLTTIIGLSELMLEQELSGGLRENISMVYQESQRTARIVKDLLTFARKHPPIRQISNINNVIEDVLRLRIYEEKINNIEVIREFNADLPEIKVDFYQMQQVFLNIICNAEFFMIETHKRGTLKVKTEKLGNFLRISVIDDGPGIPKGNLSRIFDPFFTTKEVGKGTGLGLSICHGIVTEHGGRIYAESVLGEGANFVVELPIDAVD